MFTLVHVEARETAGVTMQAYMVRLGTFGFDSMKDLIHALDRYA